MDIYTIIFLALAVFILLRLRSVLGQHAGSERPPKPVPVILVILIAVLGAVNYVAYEAKWYSALEAAVTPLTSISGPARVIDGDTVVVVGILLAMAFCAGAALFLSFLHWTEWKAQRIDPGLLHQKAQMAGSPIPHQNAQWVNPGRSSSCEDQELWLSD